MTTKGKVTAEGLTIEAPAAAASAANSASPGNGPKPEPCLSPEQMTVLADGLLAIAEEVHSHPEAESHSLSHWLTWLDEEGYDQPGISRALQQLCLQRLGAEAGQQLQAQAKARADDPRGVPSAIEHLSQNHPELLEELLAIEQTRQEQLQRLHATAGGLSKFARRSLEASGLGIVLGLGYGVHLERKTSKEIARLQAGLRQTAVSELESIGNPVIQSAVSHPEVDRDIAEWNNNIGGIKCEELISLKTMKYVIPITEMSHPDINATAVKVKSTVLHLYDYSSTDYLTDINARLFKGERPVEYLRSFNEWIISKEGKTFSELKNIASNISSKYSKIKDIPHELRHHFEGTKFVRETMLAMKGAEGFRDPGLQHFFSPLVKHYENQILANQVKVIAAKAEGPLTEEIERLNSQLELDITPEAIRNTMKTLGDEPYKAAIKGQSWVFKAAAKTDTWRANCEEYQQARQLLDPYKNNKKEAEAILRDKLRNNEISTAEHAAQKKLLEDPDLERLDGKLDWLRSDFIDDDMIPSLMQERDLIARAIANTAAEDQHLKSTLSNELEDLEDIPSWIESKSETFLSKFISQVRGEAGKEFRKALDRAQKAARRSENIVDRKVESGVQEIKGAEKNIIEDR